MQAPKPMTPIGRPTIVLSLQSTLSGCEWMIGEWARLKAVLDEGQGWLPSDKLKATRLLGKQPFDAIDERDVALVYMASFVLKPDRESWWWEIAMELAKKTPCGSGRVPPFGSSTHYSLKMPPRRGRCCWGSLNAQRCA